MGDRISSDEDGTIPRTNGRVRLERGVNVNGLLLNVTVKRGKGDWCTRSLSSGGRGLSEEMSRWVIMSCFVPRSIRIRRRTNKVVRSIRVHGGTNRCGWRIDDVAKGVEHRLAFLLYDAEGLLPSCVGLIDTNMVMRFNGGSNDRDRWINLVVG